MQTIIVASTKPYIGKSGISVALIALLEQRGLDVGYFKPYGGMPHTVEGVTSDEDAIYINRLLARPSDLADVCPVIRSEQLIDEVLRGQHNSPIPAVRQAFGRCAEGRDVMIVEGPTEPHQGAALGLALADVPALFDARVLLVDRPRQNDLPEDALAIGHRLGACLGGIILNSIDESRMRIATERVAPFLEARGLPVLGIIRHDPALASVTVAEIVEALGGRVLCGHDELGVTVESFMVGAMGQEKALRYFRRKQNKAVITGGDRSDVQLAALETSTRCLVLTGAQMPEPQILARAEQQGVPMILVESDTLTAVEHVEALFGRVHLHDPGKAAKIREMFERRVDLDRLLAAFNLG